jgi:excisionase family DNA binding protein
MGLSLSQCYRLVNARRLPAIRQGRALRVPREAFERWVAQSVKSALAGVRQSEAGPGEAVRARRKRTKNGGR